ncbi:MAG TPA: YHS domain-containing protein [Anaerolineales bacterium]
MGTAYDVVCGMTVDPASAPSAEHEGKTYYFCCHGCQGAFERAPEYHLQSWKEEHPDVDPTTA